MVDLSTVMLVYQRVTHATIANQPDTLQKMTNSLLVNVDIPIDTKRLVRI